MFFNYFRKAVLVDSTVEYQVALVDRAFRLLLVENSFRFTSSGPRPVYLKNKATHQEKWMTCKLYLYFDQNFNENHFNFLYKPITRDKKYDTNYKKFTKVDPPKQDLTF